jgi:hypothetical protein
MFLDLSLRPNSIYTRQYGEGGEAPAGEAPVISSVTIYGNAGETLTCVIEFSTAGTPTPDITYEWRGDTVALPGEDGSTCDTSAYPGEVITCYVEATNATGTDDGLSNELGPVPVIAAPTVAGVGTPQAGTGGLTVPWPTHSTGQVAILLVETANEAVTNPDAGKWTELGSSPQSGGTAATTGGCRLTVFGADVVATESDVTVADPGDHAVAAIVVIDGSTDAATFITAHTGQITASASNPYTTGTVTTTFDNSLILHLMGPRSDNASPQISNASNPDTATVDVDLNFNTAQGNGGGVVCMSWVKETAGLTSATSFDQNFTNITLPRITYAIRPAATDYGPENTVAPSITGTLMEDSTINLNDGTWDLGSPEGTLTRQLYADDEPVAGATTPTFQLTASEVGKMLRLDVLVNNGIGNVLVSSPEVGPVVPFEEGGGGGAAIGEMIIGSTFVVA